MPESDTAPLPLLYSFRRCPYAMRGRLGLLASGTVCELREVKLANKPAQMLEASPKGTVPVLVLPDGSVLEESLDIALWALGKNDPHGWLDRHDADLIAANDGPFKKDLDRYKYPNRYDSDAEAHRESGLAWLRELEARLGASRCLSGETTGLTDAAIFPFIRQFANTDRVWFDAQDLPLLQAWLAAHLASEIFARCMVRHQPWVEGDPPITFGP